MLRFLWFSKNYSFSGKWLKSFLLFILSLWTLFVLLILRACFILVRPVHKAHLKLFDETSKMGTQIRLLKAKSARRCEQARRRQRKAHDLVVRRLPYVLFHHGKRTLCRWACQARASSQDACWKEQRSCRELDRLGRPCARPLHGWLTRRSMLARQRRTLVSFFVEYRRPLRRPRLILETSSSNSR